ncbi:MAG: hypothetical protein E2O95_05690 [Acidobacteria bacterium]|nr:MAG: hypothetical protein E2O95_05690 [Acidobacteriota bacterium]
MENRLAVLAVASIVGLAACTTAGSSPATAPATTPPLPTSTTVTTTSKPPAVVSSTTTVDRRGEIEAIFLDLERRRLKAILDQDEEAYRAIFSNAGYEEESMVVMDLAQVFAPSAIKVFVGEVFVDEPSCLAVEMWVDSSASSVDGGISKPSDHVLER